MIDALPPMFPGGWRIGAEEEAAVAEVVRHKRLFRYYGSVAGESVVERFETSFARRFGVRHALALCSGSAGLVCALAATGAGPGDEVIIPAYGFVAVAAAVAAVGAVPVVADINESLTLDPADVARRITARTKVIVPVHMRAAASDMDALTGLAAEHGLRIVEDAAQACGVTLSGRPVGTIGDLGVFSLQYNKIITVGDGGVLVTNDDQLYERALMFHDVGAGGRHNIPAERVLAAMNLRMPELSGAVANVQLGRLESIVADLRRNAAALAAHIEPLLAEVGGTLRGSCDQNGDGGTHVIFFLRTPAVARGVVQALRGRGVPAAPLYDPDRSNAHVYRSWTSMLGRRGFSALGPWDWNSGDADYSEAACARSLEILQRGIAISVSPDYTTANVTEIGKASADVLRRHAGKGAQ